MKSKLIETREPSQEEAEKNHAEVVFIRRDENGHEHTIFGGQCYESWEQWNATREILGDNVETIEAWRNNLNQ